MKQAFLSLIECAYRLDLNERDWFQAIADHAAVVAPASDGAMTYSFDASSPKDGVHVGHWAAASLPQSFVESTLMLNQNTTPEDAARFYHQGIVCDTVSEVLRRDGTSIEQNDTYRRAVAGEGFPDSFGLTASNPSHTGLVINAPIDSVRKLGPGLKRAWQQTGVHLHAAYRLREALRRRAVKPEAVVEPGRGLVHGGNGAGNESARRVLESAARAADAARTRGGPEEASEALELWRGLIDGRWTMIETFESDGRRLFVAYPNDPEFENPRALTPRERLVAHYAAQGDANKWIAYQLGITPVTVARHLAVALGKLGLSHRHDLIWLSAALRSAEPSS